MVLKDGARERNGCYKIKKTRGEKNVKYWRNKIFYG